MLLDSTCKTYLTNESNYLMKRSPSNRHHHVPKNVTDIITR